MILNILLFVNEILSSVKSLFKEIYSLIKEDDSFLTNLANLLVIITTILAFLGVLFGWWKKLWNKVISKFHSHVDKYSEPPIKHHDNINNTTINLHLKFDDTDNPEKNKILNNLRFLKSNTSALYINIEYGLKNNLDYIEADIRNSTIIKVEPHLQNLKRNGLFRYSYNSLDFSIETINKISIDKIDNQRLSELINQIERDITTTQ